MKRHPDQFDLFATRPMPSAALTLWCQYAQLIALQKKRLETRSWAPPARILNRELAIHSAARLPTSGDCTPVERKAIETALGVPMSEWRSLPRSAVVAIVRVRGAVRVDRVERGWVYPAEVRGLVVRRIDIGAERDFGDFRPGQWVWHFDEDVRPISPITMPGRQGIWVLTGDKVL